MDLPIDPVWFLWGVGLPLLISAAMVLLGGYLANIAQWPWLLGLGWALAAILGGSVGFYSVSKDFPWSDGLAGMVAWDWLWILFLPVACVTAILGCCERTPPILTWALRAALILAGPVLMLSAYLDYHWEDNDAHLHLALIRAIALIVWACWWQAARTTWGRTGTGNAAMILGLTALTLMASDTITGGQHGLTAMAILLGGCFASCWWKQPHRGATAACDIAAVFLFALILEGRYFTDNFPLTPTLLLAAAPLAMWLAPWPDRANTAATPTPADPTTTDHPPATITPAITTSNRPGPTWIRWTLGTIRILAVAAILLAAAIPAIRTALQQQ